MKRKLNVQNRFGKGKINYRKPERTEMARQLRREGKKLEKQKENQ